MVSLTSSAQYDSMVRQNTDKELRVDLGRGADVSVHSETSLFTSTLVLPCRA